MKTIHIILALMLCSILLLGCGTQNATTSSDILSDLKLTEEEFRAWCQPLKIHNVVDDSIYATTLKNYPNQYLGQCFTFYSRFDDPQSLQVDFKGESSDGYVTYCKTPDYYWEEYLLFFDMRDDVYNPTISVGDEIYAYVIFSGVQTIDGIDYVTVQLISVDKR